MFDQTLLQEQVVLVTGASRGIGRQIAESCAQTGAQVVVSARTSSGYEPVVDHIRQQGGKAHGIRLDVTEDASVQHIFR